jgi:hypothetical protein
MKIIKQLGLLCVIATLLGIAPTAFADENWSDDWKISINGKTDNGGTLSFTVTFKPNDDGTVRDPVTVSAPIPEDTGENDAADMIGNAFAAILGEDDFDIDVTWGENIKVEANGDTPDFAIVIADNPLQGVSLEIEN